MSKRQHHKGRKRPRSWHRSKRSSRIFWRKLHQIEAVFRRAESDA